MATGTIVYNKDQQQIYPISDGTVIISNASGSKSNVEDDLKKLFKQVSDLSGSSGAVNSIIIKKRTKTYNAIAFPLKIAFL